MGTSKNITKKKSRTKQVKRGSGRRFTQSEKKKALGLIASGMSREAVAKAVGTTSVSVRAWIRKAEMAGTMPTADAAPRASSPKKSPVVVGGDANERAVEGMSKESKGEAQEPSIYSPRDPGQGLSNVEESAILDLKKRHPSYGPAQIRTQLKRFKGWRLSIRAIARVLRDHGYELVHRGSRPKGFEDHRFEAPRRNALWQMDFGEFWVGPEKMNLLAAEDDFSRFVVGHCFVPEKSSEVAVRVLLEAMARHGKPESIRTDRGGEFMARAKAGDFSRVLEAEEIDHIVGRAYSPKGGGKIESVIGTVRRELWDVEHFSDRAEATRRVAEFFEEYNYGRAHMGIDGLTPADRFFGRADRVLAAVDEFSRKRQGKAAIMLAAGAPFEEVLGIRTGAPLEVLRLVIVEGKMELRFCGARVCLGKIE